MKHSETNAQQRAKNLSLAAVAGQAGCATVIIIYVALVVGLWLDTRFDQRGLCTFGMLVVSVPFSLYAMLQISLRAIKRITPPVIADSSSETEEVDLD
ncbi:MAG: AtpZ/AtpI family protein [Chloroflexi bacterium AL-W]|nr:AtpZ/AtpI family protein [Chloroflexi bacterium AL-W]